MRVAALLSNHGLVLGPGLPTLKEDRLLGLRTQSLMNHTDQLS
jgi:hypothetical protein